METQEKLTLKELEQNFNNLVPNEFGGKMDKELLKNCVEIAIDFAIGYSNYLKENENGSIDQYIKRL